MILLFLTAIVSVLSATLYWLHRRKYRFADKWPTVEPTYPLLGNALLMIGKTDVERFRVIKRAFDVSDRIAKAWAGPRLLLITSHPDFIQQILTSQDCLEKPFLYDFAGFSEGLFTAKCMCFFVERNLIEWCSKRNLKICYRSYLERFPKATEPVLQSTGRQRFPTDVCRMCQKDGDQFEWAGGWFHG